MNSRRILSSHSISTCEAGGRLLALDVVTDRDRNDVSQWIDVTDFTTEQLYRWLGY